MNKFEGAGAFMSAAGFLLNAIVAACTFWQSWHAAKIAKEVLNKVEEAKAKIAREIEEAKAKIAKEVLDKLEESKRSTPL